MQSFVGRPASHFTPLPTIRRSLLRATGRRLTLPAPRVVLGHAMSKRARSIVDAPTLTLNSGHPHPQLGFGTYKVGFIPASASSAGGVASGAGDNAKDTIQAALELGYRFLDCAEFYGNEKAVGEAIVASGVPRSELFLASKAWSDTLYAGRDAIRAQVDKSLAELQTDYLDLYLVHWPVPGKHVLAYKHLEELVGEGKLRSIGLSNYTVEDYKELMEHAKIPPAVRATLPPLPQPFPPLATPPPSPPTPPTQPFQHQNQAAMILLSLCRGQINQIEVNPFLYRKQTIDFFQAQGVTIQAYRSLFAGQGKKALDHPLVTSIAEAHGTTHHHSHTPAGTTQAAAPSRCAQPLPTRQAVRNPRASRPQARARRRSSAGGRCSTV